MTVILDFSRGGGYNRRMRRKLQEAIMSTPDLPSGFTECEYLEFSGTQYLRPYLQCQGLSIYFKTEITGTGKLVGLYNVSNGEGYTAHMATNSRGIGVNVGVYFKRNGAQVSYGVGNYDRQIGSIFEGEINWNEQYAQYWIDTTETKRAVIDIGTGFEYGLNEIAIGKQNTVAKNDAFNTVQLQSSLRTKLMVFKAWYEAGTLTRDFVPVLDADGVPCMYDKASNQCFRNLGKGTFGYKIKATGEVVAPVSS